MPGTCSAQLLGDHPKSVSRVSFSVDSDVKLWVPLAELGSWTDLETPATTVKCLQGQETLKEP